MTTLHIPSDKDIKQLTNKLAYFLEIDTNKIKFNYHTKTYQDSYTTYPELDSNVGWFAIKQFHPSRVNIFTDFLYKLNYFYNGDTPINQEGVFVLPLYIINNNDVNKYTNNTDIFWKIVNFLYNEKKTFFDLIDKINNNKQVLLYPTAHSDYGGDFLYGDDYNQLYIFNISYDLYGRQKLSSVNIIDSTIFIDLYIQTNNNH